MPPPARTAPDPAAVPALSCPACGRVLSCELRDYLATLRAPWPVCCGAEMAWHPGGREPAGRAE